MTVWNRKGTILLPIMDITGLAEEEQLEALKDTFELIQIANSQLREALRKKKLSIAYAILEICL